MIFFRTTEATDTTIWKPGFTLFEMLMLMFIQYRSKLLVHLPAQYLDYLNRSCLYRGRTKKGGSNRTRRAINCCNMPQRDIIDFKGSVAKLLQLHFWSLHDSIFLTMQFTHTQFDIQISGFRESRCVMLRFGIHVDKNQISTVERY